MKTIFAFLLLTLAMGVANAEEYEFIVHRFCDIKLKTSQETGDVEIRIYPKAVPEEEVVLQSKLKRIADGSYETPHGTRFTLSKLPKAIIHDHNRHINSGNWLLKITGSGPEYLKLKKRLVPISTFRTPDPELPASTNNPEMPDMTYHGVDHDSEKKANKP